MPSSRKTDLPRVSFILPVRNAAPTLSEALDSLRQQTFRDHEILVFDDGSSDSSVEMAQEAADKDHRIRLVGARRVGLAGALQRAIDTSDAPLLARMDGDDVSHPRRLERQLALLESRPEVAVVGCRVEHFPKEAVGAGMARYEKWLNSLLSPDEIARDIFVESPLCHPSVVMRREAYDRAGGYLDDRTPEDYGLWLRMHARGFNMAKVDEVLFYWRDSPHRFSRNADQYRPDRFISLKLRHIKSHFLKGRDTVAVWGAGKTGRRFSRGLERLSVQVTSFIDIDPKKVGRRVHGAPVVSLPEKPTDVTAEALLVAVGSAGARRQIRGYLTKKGFVELRDFICVA